MMKSIWELKNLHKSILEVEEIDCKDLSPLDKLIEQVVEKEIIEARKRKGEKFQRKFSVWNWQPLP